MNTVAPQRQQYMHCTNKMYLYDKIFPLRTHLGCQLQLCPGQVRNLIDHDVMIMNFIIFVNACNSYVDAASVIHFTLYPIFPTFDST